ncbi:DUF2007 domain-containing protein [Geosporobacter ferrireducens]|uniref:DUF2007 domain-containing protein n=1 Tax=Geosporobacter ferrireducens TaxID=1424294 RepID=A0A1D8GK66_9FIRM|nr:DUF2007 domain-containing protein [Geosporobacter ferrireducens]AOT71252.1 hypothetical protein Gferi_17845 [Geosporobacter ferrireducens]MTI58064.1 DUF2007 domain-containing protein [Geosporobacter ferrireducens]
MPWCPNCSTEYREGYNHCRDCGVVLVAEKPIQKKAITVAKKTGWLLLATAQGIEASLMSNLLRDNNIPILTKQRGIDSYLQIITGIANNVEIYVPEEEFCKAQELIQVMLNPVEPEA